MNFTEIRLFNFGQYRGEHILNLTPQLDDEEVNAQPIILIGGKNGAGKTTLLEAVKLCLYGATSLGFGIKPKAYHEYLTSRIHRPAGQPLEKQSASVTVTFEHSVRGTPQTFQMERKWVKQTRRVVEALTVWRDGAALSEQEYGWWEQFLHDLLPPGLAELFFFDGEKIQALADDPDYTMLARSIRALLGLDLIDRLRTDLSIYVSRQQRVGGKGFEIELQEISQARLSINEKLSLVSDEMEASKQLIEAKKEEVEATERLLASEGGEIAAQRGHLQQRVSELQEKIQLYERKIIDEANGLLAFAVIPELCSALWDNLVQEEQVAQQMATQSAAGALMDAFMSQLTTENQWLNGVDVTSTEREKIVAGLANTFETLKHTNLEATSTSAPLLHDISNRERRQMQDWLNESSHRVPKTVQEAGDLLEGATDDLLRIQALLLKEPEEEILRPIFQKLAHLHQEITTLSSEHASQQASLQQLEKEQGTLDKKEEELHKRIMRGDDPSMRVELVKRTQQALIKYEERLRAAKIKEFEQQVVICFNRLSNKGRYVRSVKIDTKTFQTTLYHYNNSEIPKEQLSAGEKQIYAIALLWALRIVSGRRVPIIIDTPLGRLDASHRQNLVQHYFPQASHQVVLLSTDTEIEETLLSELQPAVARTYQLNYDRRRGTTGIKEGYFW